MCSSPERVALPRVIGVAALALVLAGTTDAAPRFGFGKPATAAEIGGWDIDVRPDGHGLPPGRGTVAEGQEIYDAKCASCHGTFGESNDYMAIAGGVGTLGSDQPIRTTGSKLNHATTLWDYINRAMPFGAPKSLGVDEVYALTAYVLHLNDLLAADASLDRERLIALRLPNRDGFTTAHGLAARGGAPDTRNVACMRNCATDPRLASEIPDYARDAHGNLAEQVRPVGPVEGTRLAKAARPAGEPKALAVATGADLAKSNGCTACHGTANRVVGPAFREIGTKYADAGAAEAALVKSVRLGGVGRWGQIPMPAQPQLKEGEARAIVQWILGGAR